MNIEPILKYFEQHKFKVAMYYHEIHRDKWYITVKKEEDGISIAATATHADFFLAVKDVYEKISGLITRGAPAMLYPTIDHNKPTELNYIPTTTNLDDEIPF